MPQRRLWRAPDAEDSYRPLRNRAEAERALAAVAAEVPLRDSAIVSSGLAGSLTLESLNLPPEERAACEQQLSKGGFLVVAQVVSESRSETVLRLLHNVPPTSEPEAPPEPQASPEPQAPPERRANPSCPQRPSPKGKNGSRSSRRSFASASARS
jgi:hypothetical protein